MPKKFCGIDRKSQRPRTRNRWNEYMKPERSDCQYRELRQKKRYRLQEDRIFTILSLFSQRRKIYIMIWEQTERPILEFGNDFKTSFLEEKREKSINYHLKDYIKIIFPGVLHCYKKNIWI
jgi:hypothetical protein